jgi:hypothetical protein
MRHQLFSVPAWDTPMTLAVGVTGKLGASV